MIYTCSHNNINVDNPKALDITYNCGRNVNYLGNCFPSLAPNKTTIDEYIYGKELLSEYENNKRFIENYYNYTLKKISPSELFNIINNKILLGYEDNMEISNRHIVAAWLELFLDVEVLEIKNKDGKIELLERPEYIKDYLEEYIKSTTDMKGFNSIRAIYLFRRADDYEMEIVKLENNSGNRLDNLRNMATLLRNNALEAEELYNLKKQKKLK